jgi:hypothetical protein
MTTYTVSYWVKNATEFEEGATVRDIGNGWFNVEKITNALPQSDKEFANSLNLPVGALLCNLRVRDNKEASDYESSGVAKPKRKAAWKQNPLARFAQRSNT